MKSKEILIEELRLECQKLIGREVNSHNEILTLEVLINEGRDNKISVSSLRRFFKLIPYRTPQLKTLNTLCRSLGYSSFEDFSISKNQSFEWEYVNRLISIEENGIITNNDLEYLDRNKIHLSHHLGYFFHTLIKNKKFGILNEFFRHPELFPNLRKREGEISDLIGISLRTLDKKALSNLIPYLESNYFLRIYCLYFFVDYNGFQGWYLYVLNRIKSEDSQDKLFRWLINSYYRFLKGDRLIKPPKVQEEDLHPILLGRYLGYRILYGEHTDIIWGHHQLNDPQSFFYEIFPILIIRKKWDTIRKIENDYFSDFLTPSDNTYGDKRSMAFLSFSIARISTNNKRKAKEFLKLIENESLINSYKDYIRLLSLIPKFHLLEESMERDREILLGKYHDLKEKLGFNYFDFSFLRNYFKKKRDE